MNPTYLLAWLPERLLNEKGQTEWDKFVKIEERTAADHDIEDEGMPLTLSCPPASSIAPTGTTIRLRIQRII